MQIQLTIGKSTYVRNAHWTEVPEEKIASGEFILDVGGLDVAFQTVVRNPGSSVTDVLQVKIADFATMSERDVRRAILSDNRWRKTKK